jgi:hypothetical protein
VSALAPHAGAIDPATREAIVDYIARCRAEDAAATGLDYGLAYAMLRTTPSEYRPALNDLSDHGLLTCYVGYFDLDPDEHTMDRRVVGLVLNYAFGMETS